MITYREAKKFIFPGECIYIISDGKVDALKVLHVNADSLQTEDGFLDFEDHGQTWWLTKKVAVENMESYAQI